LVSIGDLASSSYGVPMFFYPSVYGSDEIEFQQDGVYLLQFYITAAYGSVSMNAVDICSESTLNGVTILSSSSNALEGLYFTSYAIVSVSGERIINLPDQSGLLALYGTNWSGCWCSSMVAVRLS